MTTQYLSATSLRLEMAKRREALTREENDALSYSIVKRFQDFFPGEETWKGRKVAL